MLEIDRKDGSKHFVDGLIADLYKPVSETKHSKLRPYLVLRTFTNRRMFVELLEAWKIRSGLNNHLILEAHGAIYNQEWYVTDNSAPVEPVQEWINRFDGKYAAIMLLVCNPLNTEITSQKSLVFHPNKSLNLPTALATGHMRLFAPGFGYIERDYRKLRKLIDSLG